MKSIKKGKVQDNFSVKKKGKIEEIYKGTDSFSLLLFIDSS